VGKRPSDQHSLDRIKNDQGYVPGNVHWTTSTSQNHNRRPTRLHGVRDRRTTADRVTNFKHGRICTPEYKAWVSMKDRCLNPNSTNYPNWGGRGITIYQSWVDDFMTFYQDVGPRPSPSHSLDRRDNEKGYYPGNVRWATKLQQTRNRRPCKTGSTHGNFDHGHAGSPEYKTWGSVKTRCFNPKHDRYADYGGAGITMCQRWAESFEAFFEDLGPKPTLSHTLMRLNHAASYSCGKCEGCQANGWLLNCKWATKTEQNQSRRPSERSGKLDAERVLVMRKMLSEGATHKEIAKQFGVGVSLVGKIKRHEVWA
jgi:hypothetical protein